MMEAVQFALIFCLNIAIVTGALILLLLLLRWRMNSAYKSLWAYLARRGVKSKSKSKKEYVGKGGVMADEQAVASDAASSDAGSATGSAGGSGGDTVQAILAAHIETLRSLPGLVPELVGGKSLAEIQASTEVARSAYSRILASHGSVGAAAAASGQAVATTPPPPAGAGVAPGAGGGSRVKAVEGVGANQAGQARIDALTLIEQGFEQRARGSR